MSDRKIFVRENVLTRPRPFVLLGLTVGFVSLSVGVPLTVHLLGGPALGRTFLPMHFFILCAGLILGWQPGLAAGILSPAISFSMSGMPPLHLLLPLTLEMATYGLVAGLMRKVFHRNPWLSLATALIAGRIVVAASVSLLGIKGPVAYLTGSIYAGLPGIAIQVAFLPLIVKMLSRRTAL